MKGCINRILRPSADEEAIGRRLHWLPAEGAHLPPVLLHAGVAHSVTAGRQRCQRHPLLANAAGLRKATFRSVMLWGGRCFDAVPCGLDANPGVLPWSPNRQRAETNQLELCTEQSYHFSDFCCCHDHRATGFGRGAAHFRALRLERLHLALHPSLLRGLRLIRQLLDEGHGCGWGAKMGRLPLSREAPDPSTHYALEQWGFIYFI